MKRMPTLLVATIFCIACMGVSPLHAGWTIDGAPICTADGEQNLPQICSDDEGGAIVVWIESRFYPPRIFAQRLSELGRARWTVNGIQISASTYSVNRPRIIADGAGGAIVVWEEYYDFVQYDLYAQRVDSLGNLLWNAGGVAVCTSAGDQEWSAICSDGAGGCIIAWPDERSSANSDLYAQRIDAAGNPAWTADGVPICTADSTQLDVQIIEDGGGGAIIVWADYRDIGDLYAQKVNAAGAAQWAANGAPVCLNTVTQYEPRIATDGAGGAFVAWYDRRDFSFDLYMQRIASDGSEVFTPNGITICSELGSQRYPRITADGAGGAIVVWEDFRDGGAQSYLYAQRVDASGNKLWLTPSGVPIRHMSAFPYYAVIVSDQNGGAIVAWSDTRNTATSGWDVYAQRVDHTGTCLWRENGDSLCTAPLSQGNLTATIDGAGGMIAAWWDYRNSGSDIYGQRINSDGTFTASLLRSFSAAREGAGIRITWTLSDGAAESAFFVTRTNVTADLTEAMLDPAIEANGTTFRYIDDSCDRGNTYSYRIDIANGDGLRALFETDPISIPPDALRLFQNYPNPFNPLTTVRFNLPEAGPVSVRVYDAAGRHVRTLLEERRGAGLHEAVWDGRNDRGEPMASGVYFVRITTGRLTETVEAVLLR